MDGFPMDFYKGFFDILGKDLLQVVEYSRTTEQMFTPFKSTFLALIPKYDNPTFFDLFCPISL
jgi:hypothetical protein